MSPDDCVALGHPDNVSGKEQGTRFSPDRCINAGGLVGHLERSHLLVLLRYRRIPHLQHDELHVDVLQSWTNVLD